MTQGPTISRDPHHNRLAIGSENRAAPPSATVAGNEFLKSFLSFSSSSSVQSLSASLQLNQLDSVFQADQSIRAYNLPEPNRVGLSDESSDRETDEESRWESTRASSVRPGVPEHALDFLREHRVELDQQDSDVTALPVYSPGFLDPDSDVEDHPAINPFLLETPFPESELADDFHPELAPAIRREAVPATNVETQTLQQLTLKNELTTVTDGVDVDSQAPASRIQNLDPRILYRSSFYSEGAIAIDPKTIMDQNSNPEANKTLNDLLKSVASPEPNKPVDVITREAKPDTTQNRVPQNPNVAPVTPAPVAQAPVAQAPVAPAPVVQAPVVQTAQGTQVAINPAEQSTSAQPTEVDAEGAVEISFKPDRPVSRTPDSAEPLRNERRVLNRTTDKSTKIGQPPGATARKAAVYSQTERPGNVKPVALGGPEILMGELHVLPTGQRAVLESGIGRGVLPPSLNDPASQTLNDVLSNSVILGTAEQAQVAASTAFGTPATVEVLVNTISVNPGVRDVMDADATVREVVGGSKTVPSRLLNQVAQALLQAPGGDSTMRLQLNPIELGQLAIEITFRDGAMHGKLRAEQGQTLKLLQEGLEGLRARLSEQGIVVQSLEVELGQQGDFSQQQRSFAQAQDFGRHRHSDGYFSADDRAARRAAVEKEAPSSIAPRDTSGRWAVNVIV